ncbi:vitamin K epoxide reductase family protein [Pontibacter sp. 172403-2]|uniref:vitamin K epoxide reductase family protein n=1 Tax=Pontibacter rufus TaxID=2791028 RepID=UPI0018AFE9BB|nr:vitamin K epoxide reductase family protein [Pontibacter sp. 172403-2]MBF9252168.1 vitamin K epoxide reductase family protein [Pontibacter sp. 172403-2]
MGKEKKQHQHHQSEDGKHGGGMGMRGVTRPMAEQEMRQHNKKMNQHEGQQGEGHGMKMSDDMRRQMLHMHHMQTLWVYWAIIILGVWMVMSPLTFSYTIGTVAPSGGREVWLSLGQRISFMKWSDMLSGLGLIFFGWRSLTPNRPVSVWIACFIGIWLSMAPLVFWSPTAVAYLNDTLVGALVIALAILIAGMPNMIMYMKMGSEVPAGWSYNPSSWPQRWIMIVLAFVGWMASRYLGAFQLGYIDHAWDPFFGNSTRQVLNSDMSHSWPVSDAALGSLAYTFEFLMGFMGGTSRWRTMPWMVFFFGILVVPLGLVSIFLVIAQPLSVGAWCTFCLITAVIMLPMIPIEMDEVIAMGQHMVQRKRKGDSLWKVFWKGGEPVEQNSDERSPEVMEFPQEPGKVFLASIWGMSFPWTLTVSAILGIWLMFAPAVFGVGIETRAADINHLGGSLIVVVAVICMGEVLRLGRYLNVLLGLAVAIWPWFVADSNLALNISGAVAGLLVAALSVPRGAKTETYGLWDKYVK